MVLGKGFVGCIAAGLLCLSGLGRSASANDGSLSLLVENDSISRTDRYSSHGIRLGWSSGPDADRACGDHLLRWLPFIECRSDMRWMFDLAQAAFTPRDRERKVPDSADRPYAGWLYLSTGAVLRNAATLDQLSVGLGVVGPASQSEAAQKFIHHIEGIREPRGWGAQLRASVRIGYTHVWRTREFRGQLTPQAFGALSIAYRL